MFLHLLILVLSLVAPIRAAAPTIALVAPIFFKNNLYTIDFNQTDSFVIDIESPFSWKLCSEPSPQVSSDSPQCVAVQSNTSPACHRKIPNVPPKDPASSTCLTLPYNPFTNSCAKSQLTYKSFPMFLTTDGLHENLTRVNFDKIYLSCSPISFFTPPLNGTLGMVSLSRSNLSLISQYSSPNVAKKFGMCLSRTVIADFVYGTAFFGDGPLFYRNKRLPNTNVMELLEFTPLVNHPTDNLGYYIGVKRISVNGQAVKQSESMLSFDKFGHGGVKLSTLTPYTKLRSDIYRPFLELLANVTSDIPRVPKVAPFDLCFNTSLFGPLQFRPNMPVIDLEMDGGHNWTLIAQNSFISVSARVDCLAFVDGGERAEQAMVIGHRQMEDVLLMFDQESSRFGFTPSLSLLVLSCSSFFFP